MATQTVKTVNKIVSNLAYPNHTDYLGFIPHKVQYSDGVYKSKISVYKLIEVFDTNGKTLLGYQLGDTLPVNPQDSLSIMDTATYSAVYDSLVSKRLIDPITMTFVEQEQKLLMEGTIELVTQYQLFGIKTRDELEIINLL